MFNNKFEKFGTIQKQQHLDLTLILLSISLYFFLGVGWGGWDLGSLVLFVFWISLVMHNTSIIIGMLDLGEILVL